MTARTNRRVNPITGATSWRTMDTETYTVAEFDELPGQYGFRLQDVPRSGTVVIVENVTGGATWTNVTTAPSAGQVYVDYTAGFCIFNVSDNGKSFNIDYEGGGSVYTVANIEAIGGAASTISTKGDLLTYDTDLARLPVGSNGQMLVADSGESTGIKWDDFGTRNSSGDSTFSVDPETGQITNVYNVTTGTGHLTSPAEGWLCRAWVNFNGTGTVAIRAAANVSSITDNGTGDYTVNFATAMPDADYCVTTATGPSGGGNIGVSLIASRLASSLQVRFFDESANFEDQSEMHVQVFR